MKKLKVIVRTAIILAIIVLCAVFTSEAQKINSCNYNNIDTLIKYKNGQVISYKNKNGKQIVDTVFFPLKCNININSVDVMIVDEDKKLKRPK